MHRGFSIQSNVTNVESSSICTVMLCMLQVLKEVQFMVLHIFAHNFLNIQPIINPKKVLKSWDLELPNHTILYMLKHVRGVEGQNNLQHL